MIHVISSTTFYTQVPPLGIVTMFAALDLFGKSVEQKGDGVLPGAQLKCVQSMRWIRFGGLFIVGLSAYGEVTKWWEAQTAWESEYTVNQNSRGAWRLILEMTFPNVDCADIRFVTRNTENIDTTRSKGGFYEETNSQEVNVPGEGCRAKINALFVGVDGGISYIPSEQTAGKKLDMSHIVHSASFTPVFNSYFHKLVPLNIPTGKLIESGNQIAAYDTAVLSMKVHVRYPKKGWYLDNQNTVRLDVYEGKMPRFDIDFKNQIFGMDVFTEPPPLKELLAKLVICLGGVLALCDLLTALYRHSNTGCNYKGGQKAESLLSQGIRMISAVSNPNSGPPSPQLILDSNGLAIGLRDPSELEL